MRDAFSKRTRHGTDAARAYARRAGLDWDELDDARKIGLAKQGVQGDPRQAKQDDLGDWASWHRQADALGWQPRSVLDPNPPTQDTAIRTWKQVRADVAAARAKRRGTPPPDLAHGEIAPGVRAAAGASAGRAISPSAGEAAPRSGTGPAADQAAEPSEAIRRLRASMQAGKVPTPKPL